MEADSTQHKMLKAKKRRNSSISVSSLTTSSSSSTSSRSNSKDRSSSTSSSSSSSVDRRKKKKSNVSKRKKTRKRSSSGSESELDLTKELLPISGYIKTKDIMLEQMFKSISRKKLKAMLPDILKTVPLNKLKKMCLDQLEVMSKKRIYRTLAGENPEAISSSGTDESTDEAIKTVSQLTPQKPDILQNIEVVDKTDIEDLTNSLNGDVNKALNSDAKDTPSNDSTLENKNSTDNLKNVNVIILDKLNNSSSNADLKKSSESEFDDMSCDESIPSSLPNLEFEPEDFYGPFHNPEDNVSDSNDVAHESDDSIDNSSVSENTENNDKEDNISNINTDSVEGDDILSLENTKKEYFLSDINIEKFDCDISSDPKFNTGQIETLNSQDINFDSSDASLIKRNSLNLDNSYQSNEAQYINISSTCSFEHLSTSNVSKNEYFLEDQIENTKLNEVAAIGTQEIEKTIKFVSDGQQAICLNNCLNVDSSNLFSSSDIDAMIMKVDDKEFYDEEDDEVKVDSTIDIIPNIVITNPVQSNKINEHTISTNDIVFKTLDTTTNDTVTKENIIECPSSIDNKSELEMLELEMRARAIKAMIKAQEDSKLLDTHPKQELNNSKTINEVNDIEDVKNYTDTRSKRISVKSRLGSVVSVAASPSSKVYQEPILDKQVNESCGLLVSLGQDGEPRTVDLKIKKETDLEFLNTRKNVDFGISDKHSEIPKSERHVEIMSTNLRN